MSQKHIQRVYFFCQAPKLDYDPPCHWYQHLSICLAEGLRDLGIEVYSNVNYWKLSAHKDSYLFKHHPNIKPEDCSIVIVNDAYTAEKRPLPENLFAPNRTYITVFLDGLDVMRTRAFESEFRQFDYILQAHYSSKAWYPENIYPWTFGLSKRILEQTQSFSDFSKKDFSLMMNFRHTSNMHSVRAYVNKHFLPLIEKHYIPIDARIDKNITELSSHDLMHYIQTGQRHFPSYYKRLQETALVACFGGFFVAPLINKHSTKFSLNIRRIIKKLGVKTDQIIQWDSWRFWESLAAGCIAIHLDFEKYGAKLPVMPRNWQHYIGIDLNNLEADIKEIATDKPLLEHISNQGRAWAIQHYHPLPTAKRFLDLLQLPYSESIREGSKNYEL